ncbi:DUF4279 domain-containing protein [Caulobacter sp. S45]|uniref:DUF4279 domain-containing protein n=1 Tax=Caulobacter sp. S45 TaxID=1641861 RepID=UPI00131D00CD|nr:DUF4279 domain-containing protein [Caulobacter sp. S45]
MAAISRTVDALRLFGDDLIPAEISSLLGSEPTAYSTKGGVRSPSPGKDVVAKTGSWRLRVEDRSPGDLDGQIRELLSQLTSDLFVWQDLSRRYRCDIFCGLFMEKGNEGDELQPDTMVMIGTRELCLGFDIYDSTPD